VEAGSSSRLFYLECLPVDQRSREPPTVSQVYQARMLSGFTLRLNLDGGEIWCAALFMLDRVRARRVAMNHAFGPRTERQAVRKTIFRPSRAPRFSEWLACPVHV
jgi:hypothetical protein